MPRLSTAQKMQAKMQARMTPAQIVSARLLELPMAELTLAVREELAANPALELMEASHTCASCGLPAPGMLCPACAIAGDDPRARSDGIERDPLMTIAAPRSFTDAVLEDLCASIPAADHAIAVALVGNLDDHGFIATGPDEIAVFCGVDEARVTRVLVQLRQLGPPGLGSREPREWLLTQLEGRTDTTAALARRMIEDHLDDLAANRDALIASTLGVAVDAVRQARAAMQEELRPFPVMAPSATMIERDAVRYQVPDVAIHETGGVFVAEVLASSHRWLRLAPAYAQLATTAPAYAQLATTAAALGDDEQAHVRLYVERARMFLRGMKNRHLTLHRVADSVVRRQQGFLRNGVKAHVPLTRTEVADELALHVSSISRAVSGKSVQLPTRRVIDFSELFETSMDAKKTLRRLLEHENAPRTDEDLARELATLGFTASRRTVAKYRDELGIAPYRARIRAARDR